MKNIGKVTEREIEKEKRRGRVDNKHTFFYAAFPTLFRSTCEHNSMFIGVLSFAMSARNEYTFREEEWADERTSDWEAHIQFAYTRTHWVSSVHTVATDFRLACILKQYFYIYLERAYRQNFHFKNSLATVYIAFGQVF